MIVNESPPLAEYMVISRGQWDEALSRDEIQNVIDQFYTWLDQLVDEGKMIRGQRLTYEGRTITRQNLITDGPFGETKEVIGGYWFIRAHNLDEAAQIAKGNPCLESGLFLEIRPIAPQSATPDNTRSDGAIPLRLPRPVATYLAAVKAKDADNAGQRQNHLTGDRMIFT